MTTKKLNKEPEASTKVPSRAFTIQASGRMPAIIFEMGISPPVPAERQVNQASIRNYPTVWSTASNISRVSEKLIQELNLIPTGSVADEPVYSLGLHLPNKIHVRLNGVGVMDTSTVKDQAQCLVGMDVISQGDVSLSHKDGKTFFSFRVPCLGGEDYVISSQPEKIPNSSTTMVSRNQMCPCGSGKRHKNCCGRIT